MERTIDTIWVRVSGRMEVPTNLKIGDDVEVVIKGSVVSQQVYDNQDNTVSVLNIVKSIECELKNEATSD